MWAISGSNLEQIYSHYMDPTLCVGCQNVEGNLTAQNGDGSFVYHNLRRYRGNAHGKNELNEIYFLLKSYYNMESQIQWKVP